MYYLHLYSILLKKICFDKHLTKMIKFILSVTDKMGHHIIFLKYQSVTFTLILCEIDFNYF